MALARRPQNPLNDENSRTAVKLQGNAIQGTCRVGLKQQQPIASERKIVSDNSNNTNKSVSSFGTPKPSPKPPPRSVFRSSENLAPNASAVPSQSSSQKPLARVPLRNTVNGARPAPSVARGGVKPSQKKKSECKFNVTAQEWAKEDIPIGQTHVTRQDMNARREKIVEAEIEETVAMVRNCRGGGFPSFSRPSVDENNLPGANGFPAVCNYIKVDSSTYYEKGRLKSDPRGNSFDEDVAMDMDSGNDLEAPSSTADGSGLVKHGAEDSDYPIVPEVWPVLRDGVRRPTTSG